MTKQSQKSNQPAATRVKNLLWTCYATGRRPVAAFNLLLHRLRKEPYAGSAHAAHQDFSQRYQYFDEVVARVAGPSIKVMEIGSWAGGSAIAWARAVQRHGAGRVVCVDPWVPYQDESLDGLHLQIMRKAAETGTILNLFLHNIRASGLEGMISPFKIPSEEGLRLFGPVFDIVYIDGNHDYEPVCQDVRLGRAALKPGGWLCGDDYDETHPAVQRALHTCLGDKIEHKNGFWFKQT